MLLPTSILCCFLVISSYYLRKSSLIQSKRMIISIVLIIIGLFSGVFQLFAGESIRLSLSFSIISAISCLSALAIDRNLCVDAIIYILNRRKLAIDCICLNQNKKRLLVIMDLFIRTSLLLLILIWVYTLWLINELIKD